METDSTREKRNLIMTHLYCCKSNEGGECDSSPNTPVKNVSTKLKKAKVNVEHDLSLSEVQDNIIHVLTTKTNEINDKMDDLKLKKSTDHCFLEVSDLKKENISLKSKCSDMKKKLVETEQRVNETDI